MCNHRLHLHQFLFLVLAVVLFLVNITIYKNKQSIALQPTKQIYLLKPNPVPVAKSQTQDWLVKQVVASQSAITAQSVLAIDLNSGSRLVDYQAEKLMSPASTTKLMTALVARRMYHPDRILTVRPDLKIEGHVIGFGVGEKQTVSSLIKAILINSGNDAAEILAQNHPQGSGAFIDEMNLLAGELGMNQTAFANASGLDSNDQFTTAYDLSILAREVLKDPFLTKLVRTEKTQITDISGKIKHELYNTNILLGKRPDVFGIKTGTTEKAGQVLISLVRKEDREILIILMNSESRYSETEWIIDQVFASYDWYQL